MKRILIVAAVTASFAATPILANQSFFTALTASETAIEHSGGCRKSSPQRAMLSCRLKTLPLPLRLTATDYN